jgi:hypothetical protein
METPKVLGALFFVYLHPSDYLLIVFLAIRAIPKVEGDCCR